MNNDLTIHQLFEAYAAKYPDHISIIEDERAYLYEEVDQKSNQLAHYLKSFHLPPDTFIGISIERSAELIIGILAILKAGLAYLPLDSNHPKDRVEYLINDSEAPLLLTRRQTENKFSHTDIKILCIDQMWKEIAKLPTETVHADVKPSNLAYAIYTSGSTGLPKGVLVEHKSIVNYTQWIAHYSRCEPQSRIDFSSNYIFDMSVTTSISAIALGLQIVTCKDSIKKNILHYLQYLQNNRINFIKLTPSYFRLLIEAVENRAVDLPHLKTIVLGGEILRTSDCAKWLKKYPNHILINEYGPTEATVAVTHFEVNRHNINNLSPIVPIGKPGFNITCELLDEHYQRTKTNELSELFIGGKCLARGYLKQEKLTREAFINNPFSDDSDYKTLYRTGDLCRYTQDGNIEYIGRRDEQIKIRGYRVELGEIKNCLSSHPLVKDVNVVSNQPNIDDVKLTAYYIPKDKRNIPHSNELREFLQMKLPEYMIPSSFVCVNSFTLTENDKLNTKVVSQEIISSDNETENKLLKLWKEAFHDEDINLASNFFELGGHSLIAATLTVKIERTMGKKIDLIDLYRAPSIRELAVVIDQASPSEPMPESMNSTVNDNHDDMPLSDFQLMFWLSSVFEPEAKKLNIVSKKKFIGHIDCKILTAAFNKLVDSQAVLCYQPKNFAPMQTYLACQHVTIKTIDISQHSDEEKQRLLKQSIDELLAVYPWQKDLPLIRVRLFRVAENESELQFSAPHIIFDDASIEVFFTELSRIYCQLSDTDAVVDEVSYQYVNYVRQEQTQLNRDLTNDIHFWQQYLSEAVLLRLPESIIIKNMRGQHYSTYIPLSDNLLKNMQRICSEHALSIADLLCASIGFSIRSLLPMQDQNKIFMNIIRSMRDNDIYEKMIGCFLRLDPVLVDLSSQSVIDLSKKVQQSRVICSQHQACSSMVKLACLDQHYKHTPIKNYLITAAVELLCKFFPSFKLNPQVLAMYGRLNTIRTKQHFLININILYNFIRKKNHQQLFGIPIKKDKILQYDISTINNVLDICLLKDSNEEQAYLVISGNIPTSFRDEFGKSIINAITKTASTIKSKQTVEA